MNSTIALIGGETFTEAFEHVHMHLIDLARATRLDLDDQPIRVVYLVTCAADDGAERVGYLRERAQKKLGLMGLQVLTPPVVDRQSAMNLEFARQVSEADWIYFSGGRPHIGMRILSDSWVLEAILAAYQRGALISGSSAGAMMMCSKSIIITPEMDAEVSKIIQRGKGQSDWKIPHPSLQKCLGLVPQSMCWPHMNQFFSAEFARDLLPSGYRFIGIDESTAVVRDTHGKWQVWGKGSVVVGSKDVINVYPSGTDIDL